ncbi:MAG: hypothetical protein ACRDPV_04275 [Gaiellaceae bacterium]
MTVWLTRVHMAMLRLGDALRRYWRRIAIGAFCGWLVSTVFGALALVGFESANWITAEDSSLLGPAIVWMGVGVGACVAYVAKPDPTEAN